MTLKRSGDAFGKTLQAVDRGQWLVYPGGEIARFEQQLPPMRINNMPSGVEAD
jgi:hypothetical protein